jgi:hypothetical protein
MAYHSLLLLFSSPQEADAIEGDLCEERASIAARDGHGAAARWYRRQMIRSITELALGPFRAAPFTMLGLGILCLAATWPLNWLAQRSAQTLVINLPVYQYVAATTFWQLVPLPAMLILGFVIAAIGGRRAMSTALAAVLVMAIIVCVIDPSLMLLFGPARRPQMSVWSWVTRALYALSTWGMVVLAGTALGIGILRRFSTRPDRRNARLRA